MPKKLHGFFDLDMLDRGAAGRTSGAPGAAGSDKLRRGEIMSGQAYDDSNIFARILRGELPCTKVLETEAVLAFMDIMPRADGHVLVIPKTPVSTLLDIDTASLEKLILEVRRIARAAKQALGADGLTIWQFNEPAGGQEVPHLHFHVIPRRNNMDLRPRTGAMEKPETLERLRDKIVAALEH